MSKPSLLLIGAGGHAHACIDVIEQHGHYQIAGLIGTTNEVNDQHLGYSVIGTDEDLPEMVKNFQFALITLGQIKTAAHRLRLFQQVEALGFQLPTIIAPSAYVSHHACIGVGTIIMHGAIINAGARVGNNCIINTRALVEHDVIVEDNCHVSTGAVLNGAVVVGSGSFVGSGCIIKQGISIGTNCLIGMNLSVRHSLSNQVNFTGHYKK
jgi:sugar O-acyltransferase (sialic acid O-acetyltransferase NeuD family)